MKPRKAYHHGALREALLVAAEEILSKDGLPSLTLRAIARKAGVSHGSPAHHFRDLSSLLSELAATGFRRLAEYLQEALERSGPVLVNTDRAYIRFAVENPAMFSLMFREERLDSDYPALVAARTVTFGILAQVSPPLDEALRLGGSLQKIGTMISRWSFVHGFAILAIEGRLQAALAFAPPGTDLMALLDAAQQDRQSMDGATVTLPKEAPAKMPPVQRAKRKVAASASRRSKT